VLVTGDVKYHDARDAETLGMALVDAGHFATELVMVRGVADILKREVEKKRYRAEIVAFDGEREPFRYV
jgi:putative NIF3 family GTP cyclohydrolase 1 type 2